MPEGPEVRISAELVKPLVINKRITSIAIGNASRYKNDNPEGYDSFEETLSFTEVKVKDVNVKGKFMYWKFSNDWYLMSTFGMSGQWSATAGKHPCLFFEFEDGSEMVFNDPRHFGTIKFVKGKQALLEKLDELGWDPFTGLDAQMEKWLHYTLAKTVKPIGQILMDQSIFAGVGNYIKSESLYRAGISPWRPCNKITQTELAELCQDIIAVMKESYQHQGATILTYKSVYGEEGQYSSCFKVYGQKIDPFGNKIISETTPDKRTTHWCPALQK